MERVDLSVLGLGVRVSVADKGVAEQIRLAWARCAASSERPVVPDVDVHVTDLHTSPEVILEQLTQTITIKAIDQHAGSHLMLHAAAVAAPDTDRAVVLVGPSGMGKTTVAATLGRRWAYVTDECALVTDGLVLPYPKPLSVVGPGPKRQVSPDQLGLVAATRSSEVVGLVLLRRTETSAVHVDRPSTARAIALLAEHVSYLAKLRQPLRQLAELIHIAGGLRVVSYREAHELEPVVADLLAGRSQ